MIIWDIPELYYKSGGLSKEWLVIKEVRPNVGPVYLKVMQELAEGN